MSKEYKGKKGYEDSKNTETEYLVSARSATTAIRALEYYSQHWDCLDKMFGEGNEATKASVREYQDRVSKGKLTLPDNDSDRRALEIKEASFLYDRVWPANVANILKGQTFSKYLNFDD